MGSVGVVERPVGGVADVYGPEQLIDARQELRARVDVAQLGQPFDVVDRRASDQTADGFCEEQMALEISRQTVAAEDRGAGGRGEMIQVLRRHARPGDSPLDGAAAMREPDNRESLLE